MSISGLFDVDAVSQLHVLPSERYSSLIFYLPRKFCIVFIEFVSALAVFLYHW